MLRDEHLNKVKKNLLNKQQNQIRGMELLKKTLRADDPYMEAIRQGIDPKYLPESVLLQAALRKLRGQDNYKIVNEILARSIRENSPKGLLDFDEQDFHEMDEKNIEDDLDEEDQEH